MMARDSSAAVAHWICPDGDDLGGGTGGSSLSVEINFFE
jgi:hypothetical protein